MQQDSSEESCFEEQCHREISSQNDEAERDYGVQRDNSLAQVWSAFQDSATAVAHLYRERSSNIAGRGSEFTNSTSALWLPFQTAAGTVTTLYKDSCEGIKRTGDAALQSGYKRRTRELAEWARSKKRRLIRREDLLAYLAGKALPPIAVNHNRRSPRPEQSGGGYLGSQSTLLGASHGGHNTNPTHYHPHHHHYYPHHHHSVLGQGVVPGMNERDSDLHTFKEALILRPRGPELFAFVANEIARHCKRPASPADDKMDVCHFNTKRARFT